MSFTQLTPYLAIPKQDERKKEEPKGEEKAACISGEAGFLDSNVEGRASLFFLRRLVVIFAQGQAASSPTLGGRAFFNVDA